MATLEERLEDEEYKLWVKDGVCIAAVKKGLEEFARTRSQRVHTHVKTALNNNPSVNNLCPHANIEFDRGRKKWTLGCCLNCQVYVDELENLKNPPFTFKPPNWKNTDIKQWPNEPWEMMKVFMNAGQLATQKDPKESDLSAILNFITHCKIPRVDIYDQNNISKVREARNEIMHSAQMKISLGDFQKHTKAMIDLLEDKTFLNQLQDAKDAVKIIKEVQGASFCITRSDEVKALNEKTTAISERNITLTAEIAELRSEQEHIKKAVDSGIEKLETLVKTETEDRQQAIDRLTKEIEMKEKALKKLSVEISFVNRRIKQDKALYRKMDIRVKTVEKSLRKTEKEFKGIKQEHSDMKNDLDEIKSRLQIKNGSTVKNDNTKDLQIQERKIAELQLELNEKHTRHEQDVSKLRTRIKELENEIYSRRKEANSCDQEMKQDTELVNKLRDENKELTLAYDNLNDTLRNLTESTVQEWQIKLKEATEMNDALQYDNSVLKDEIDKLRSKAENNLSNVELQEYANRSANQENEIDRLGLELRESDREIKEAQERLQKNQSKINELEAKLQREMSNAEIIKKDKLNTEEVLRDLTKDGALLLSEAADKLADVQNHIQHTIYPDGDWSPHEDNADDEIKTLIKSLFSKRRTLIGETVSETNVDKLKQLIIEMISDLEEKFDREHQLRNTAEKSLRVSQTTIGEFSMKIVDLQHQLQTEKKQIEALEEHNKLSASVATETARKDISDLQQKLDQEHQLRNTAEKDLKASQKANEELSVNIKELQRQVQTEKEQHKNSIKALEEEYKLSSSVASETARTNISDLQQKLDQEHQLRNTAEKDLKASQKANEELSVNIKELQRQVQTEKEQHKNSIKALEEEYKLSSSVASETARTNISDLQQKLDQEHQLRNTAEKDLKASQKANEELSVNIKELQRQVQTEKEQHKNSIKALEEEYKLSSSVASETARTNISDLQQKLDQEHQLRNTAEKDLKASQKANEELSVNIKELQRQVQTEKEQHKNSIKALEEEYKLSSSVASETARTNISAE